MNVLEDRKRRWFQFRLQTLAGAFVVWGLVFTPPAMIYNRARWQRDAVRAIRQAGGNVYSEAASDELDRFLRDFHPFGEPSSPSWLATFMGDDAVTSVNGVVYTPQAASPKLVIVPRSVGWLWLTGAKVGDADLVDLEGCARLEALSLSATGITDQGLPALARLQGLRQLSLAFTNVSDDNLAHLNRLDRLEALQLIETKVTAAGVERLHQALPNAAIRWSRAPTEEHRQAAAAITRLGGFYDDDSPEWHASDRTLTGVIEFGKRRRVYLLQTHFWRGSDADFVLLRKIVGLKSVSLILFSSLSPEGIEHLRDLHDLEELILRNSSITDADLFALTKSGDGLHHLKVLNLQDTKISDTGVECLANFRELESLNLQRILITGAGLGHLKRNTRLRELDLTGVNLTDEGWAQLSQLNSLAKLRLDYTNITDGALVHLKDLDQLEELHLLVTKVTDGGLMQLAKLIHLRELTLYETQVTVTGADELRKALPQCKIVHSRATPYP